MHAFKFQKRRARELVRGCVAAAVLASVCVAGSCAQEAPKYRVDPFWPQELPNRWIIGQIGGIKEDDPGGGGIANFENPLGGGGYAELAGGL